MNRKKFFTSVTMGAIGFAIYNSYPIKFFSKKADRLNHNAKVKINSLAVSRKKVGDKNV